MEFITYVYRQDARGWEAASDGCGDNNDSAVSLFDIHVASIAGADFESLPEVIAFVSRVAECHSGDRFDRAMTTAWDRNESGWRTVCEERAERICSKLYGAAK